MIPKETDLPEPIIIDNGLAEETSGNATLENMVNMTVVFPDALQPNSRNGGYENNDEFEKAIMQLRQSSNSMYKIHSRPSSNMLRDYLGDNLLRAFPL